MIGREIKTVVLVGTGVIGAGWAARLVSKGINVVATDISADCETRLRSVVEHAQIQMNKLIPVKPEKCGTLNFTTDFEAAMAQADFIQENAPDRVDLKRELIKKITTSCAPDVIVASSSSNLRPTEIQADATNPERVIIGHPFNPVYLCPIVELVMGEKTSQETYDRACEFYTQLGMKPLHVKKEVDGYIANRLQEAMWREILYMVRDGIAEPKDIDDAIIYGFGIRLAFMGTCLTFHLGGGPGGMTHLLDHFGSTLKDPLSYLIGPDLTPELRTAMIEGVEKETDGMSIEELETVRDNCMIEIMRALSVVDYASGKVINDEKKRLKERGLLDE